MRDYQPPSTLIWAEALKNIERSASDLREFLLRPNVQRMPDGSVYITGRHDVLLMHELLLPHRQSDAVRLRENTQFRPLRCFGLPLTEYYALMTTNEYFQQIGGEEDFLISPTVVGNPMPGEEHPERLFVRVRFWGGLEKAARPRFFQAMVAWADSIGTQGIFGEGSAYLFPESFLFNRRWASFEIDISGSGQHTINWLTLSILNFAAQGDYVSMVSYGDSEDADNR
jgi:hypothetical protein